MYHFELLPIPILIQASYLDMKNQTVPNIYSLVINLMALPAIILNKNITPMHILFIIGILALHKFNGLGGADIKVLPGIILSLSPAGYVSFLFIMALLATCLYFTIGKRYPLFPAIAGGYTAVAGIF